MALPKLTQPEYDFKMASTQEVIKYRPFTVKEEKILLLAYQSKNEKEQVNAVKQIIRNCTFDKVDPENMAIFDLEMLFIRIRAKSIGEIIDLRYSCSAPDCKEKPRVKINLEEVDFKITENNNKIIHLSNTVGVTMRYPTVKDMSTDVESEYDRIFNCIETIFDSETVYDPNDFSKEELNEFNDSMDHKQKEKLVGFLDGMPTVEHEVKYECKCGHTDTIKLKGIKSFF